MIKFIPKWPLLLFIVLLLSAGFIEKAKAQISCDFILQDSIKCAPFVILATANETSSFPIVQRRWSLSTCTGTNVFTTGLGLNSTFSYISNIPGCYCLKLWSINSNGDTCSTTRCNITVAANPTINFSFSPTEGCSPLAIQAICNSTAGSGVIDSLAIDWGCGGTYFNSVCPANPINKLYNCPPGCISPTVVIKNSAGCYSDTTYANAVCIIPKPIANFTADVTTSNCATNPLTVNFTADSAGSNITYTWYINSTQVQAGPSRFLNHVFPINPNCYDITLVVRHITGGACSDSITKKGYICVRAQPVISFAQNITTACVKPGNPATLVFYNTSAGLPSMTWTLSGGSPPQSFTPKTGDTVSFTINNIGTYNLSVTGTFGSGCSATITQQVLVANLKPVADFTASDTFGCSIPFPVDFTVTNPCAGCNYNWTFGNGIIPNPVNTQNPVLSVTVNQYLSINARLIITNTNGCSDTLGKNSYIVAKRLNPKIGLNKSKGCPPVCVTFTDKTNYSGIPDPISSTCWSFPGSIIPGGCQPSISNCFSTIGCYSVRLVVTTTTGCADSITFVDTVCVGAPPVCSVSATPTTMCFEEDTVCFALACDSFDYARVDYGDGVIEFVHSSTFCHFYQDTGTFHPIIIAYNDSCKGDTLQSLQINVLPPIAAFHDSVTCSLGDTIILVNDSKGADSFVWHFCNGDSSHATNPKLLLPLCDTCSVTLIATNNNGCVHKKSETINTPCQSASFSPSDTSGCANLTVKFTNTSSSTNPLFTRWDFDLSDGIQWSQTKDTIVSIFTKPGVFTVSMRNKSNNGCVDTVYGSVRVCKVQANFSPTSVCYPLPLNLTDLSIDSTCGITNWSWSFGDGSYSSSPTPVHNYSNPGQYQVGLRVTNADGCTDTITKTVSVAPANINYRMDTLICPGKQGCVVNNSTGTNLTYQWDIPGALPQSTFTSASPCYSFGAIGDYIAYVHISSGGQCDFYDTLNIHNHYPQAGGYVSANYISCPNPPTILQFHDTSKYVDSSWLWNFGDNSFSVFRNPGHIYNFPGCYAVTQTVTTKDGCTHSVFIDSICVDGPYGEFGFNPTNMCSCKDTINFTINTVNSTNLTLVYGCNQGFSQVNPIQPIGSATNPTSLQFQVPYCVADSCKPQLIFGDAGGCQVYLDGNYAFIDSPIVNFTFDNYGVCVQGTVCFQDITSYHLPSNHSSTAYRVWDFGDGSPLDSSQSANPCHYYSQPGGYNARLYIHSNFGCYDSIVSEVVVVPEFPIAGFYADDSLVCANNPICFHDTSYIYPLTGPQYWIWDFGDNSGVDTSYTPDLCHSFSNGGYYRVTMCVYDSVGCPDCDSSVVIRVIDNPIADAGGDRNICYGIVTQINGSGGTVPHWEPSGLFSNDTIFNPTVQLYQDTMITINVGDQYGCADTDTAVLSISRVFANFSAGATYCEGEPVCVTDSSTSINGTLVNWIYNFGDADTATGANVCHIYQVFGNMNISEYVMNNNGCTDSASKQVNILPKPEAAFSLNDTVLCSDQQLCITDLSTSTSPITSWNWSFGDGQTSSSATPPCHSYSLPFLTVYDVTIVVVDQNNCRDTASIPATINEVPNADFTWSTSCETDMMPLSSTSTQGDGAIISCEWLFWVGAPTPVIDNNCNTSFKFPAGSYPVQLVVKDINGCADTIVKTVIADSLSQLVIYPGDTTICLGTSVNYTVSGVFDNIIWTPNVWLNDPYAATVTVTPLANIGYTVSATNGVCAAASDTFSIRTIQPIPLEVEATPKQVVLGLSSNISSQIGANIDSIIWFPDATLDCRNCPNPIALPDQTTTYTATIYYSENNTTCTTSDSVTIEVLRVCDNSIIFIPNTFTPNGDGLNDIFMIRGLAATKINYFRIFDRWGKLLFESETGAPNDPKWGWNGTDNQGQKLNSAVYVYSYEIQCINGDIVKGKGNVTLIR